MVIDEHDIGTTYELHRKAYNSAVWFTEEECLETLDCARKALDRARREEPDETWRIAKVTREIVE